MLVAMPGTGMRGINAQPNYYEQSRVCITVDGSLRTGQRSNSGPAGRREGQALTNGKIGDVSSRSPRHHRSGRDPDFADGASRGRFLHPGPAVSGVRVAGLVRAGAGHSGRRVRVDHSVADRGRPGHGDRTHAAEQRDVAWSDIEGLRFGKGSWARAQLTDGRSCCFRR